MAKEELGRIELILILFFLLSSGALGSFHPSFLPGYCTGFLLLFFNYLLLKWLFLGKRRRWLLFILFIFKALINLGMVYVALKFIIPPTPFIIGILVFPFFLAISFLILYFFTYGWQRT